MVAATTLSDREPEPAWWWWFHRGTDLVAAIREGVDAVADLINYYW